MKTKLIAAALIALGAAASANANCLALEHCPGVTTIESKLTRAEVRAEALEAARNGTLITNDIQANAFNSQPGGQQLTREQVRAGAIQAARKPINVLYPS